MDGFVKCKIYDKRDDFDFDIMNFPFQYGDVPRSRSYGVYISQLIRLARVSSHVDEFNTHIKVFTAKLFRQGYKYHKDRKIFSKFYRRLFDIVSNKGLSESDFCGDLVYKFRKIGYNIDVLRQTAWLVVNLIKVNGSKCTTVGRALD